MFIECVQTWNVPQKCVIPWLERFNFECASEILKSPDQRRESTGKLKVSAE
jgi:hypothetical protein